MSTATLTRAVAEVASTSALRAVRYFRISDDKAGQGLGVERQDEDTADLLARRGYREVGVYSDNDISAWSGKPRPGYLALVEEIRAGRVDVIVVYRADRLYRRNRELEDLIDLLDGSRVVVDVVTAGKVDLSTTDGRRQARIMGAIAQGESEDIRDKVRRTMIQNAELGKVHGALRTYGLRGTRVGNGHEWEIVEDEAAVIVEAVDRVLAGESVLAVTNDLNARGIRPLRGASWNRQSLRKIILSARIAGWREHTPGRAREASPFAAGAFIAPAEWPAIVDRSKVERLRRMLTDPARQRGPAGRSYLLSGGLAVCECGANLRGRPARSGPTYACPGTPGVGKGCGRVAIGAAALDEWVEDAVREAHRSGRFDAEVADVETDSVDEVWGLVERLREEVAELSADKGSGLITRAEWLAAREPLLARLATAEADLARRQETEAAALLVGGVDEFDARWAEDKAAGNLSAMRARLLAAFVEVRVSRQIVPRSHGFDSRRVAIEWRA